jgi:lipopolysaccharide biosynthesis glycosyltransferase
LFQNNDIKTTVYVFQSDFSKTDESKLVNYVNNWGKKNDNKIHIIKIDNSIFNEINTSNEMRWPKEVFYRLLASVILPKHIKKILYLDADIIIDKSIMVFYNMDFYGKALIACEDSAVTSQNMYSKRLNIPDPYYYFNSGVLLFNLELLRVYLKLEKVLDNIDTNSKNIIYPDQDLLNSMLYDKVLICDFRKYNFMCDSSRYKRKYFRNHVKNAAIFHFGGGNNFKPWHYKYAGELSYLWWKYAKYTEYRVRYKEFKIKNKFYKSYHWILVIFKIIRNIFKYKILKMQ